MKFCVKFKICVASQTTRVENKFFFLIFKIINATDISEQSNSLIDMRLPD